ncbi:MAG: hypothetical protein AB4290_27270, partial [Spirulina sp.]
KKNADPKRGEIEEDSRFKYDKDFIKNNILSAFLNRVLDALARLPEEGIDTTATKTAFEEARRQNNHLLIFCEDMGLVEAEGVRTPIKDIYDRLLWWYQHENGVLSFVGERKVWEDQIHPCDKNIKAINQLTPRLKALFPRAQRGRTNSGSYIEGISFLPEKAQIISTPFTQEIANPDDEGDTEDLDHRHTVFTSSSRSSDRASRSSDDEMESVQHREDGVKGQTIPKTLTEKEIPEKREAVKQQQGENEELIIQCQQYMESCQSLDEYHEVKNADIFDKETRVQAWSILSTEKKTQINRWIQERDIASALADFEFCEDLEVYTTLTQMYKPDVLQAAFEQLSPDEQAQIDRLRQPVPELENCNGFQVGDFCLYRRDKNLGIGEVIAVVPDNITVKFKQGIFNPHSARQDVTQKVTAYIPHFRMKYGKIHNQKEEKLT